jgi:hypothetical protein
MVLEPFSSLRWMKLVQAHEGRQWTLVGMPRVGESHKGPQWGRWVPSGGDCHIAHRLERVCTYMYIPTLLDTKRFKAVMTMNLSEICS